MKIVLILLLVIILIIYATVKFKVHPLFSLTIAALITGLLFGFEVVQLMDLVVDGFGKTLSGIGLVIAFGTVIGVFLERNGGTQKIAASILRRLPTSKAPMAMNIIGFIISIPVFCDSGFIILSSLNKALSKKTGIPLVAFAVCLATGLYATHVFVPPTPGPLAAASILEADLGMVMLTGFGVAIPVTIAGMLWGTYLGRKIITPAIQAKDTQKKSSNDMDLAGKNSKLYKVLMPILVPILLIGLRSIADYPGNPLGDNWFKKLLDFMGHPVVALLIGVFLAVISAAKVPLETKNKWIVSALKDAGVIILITGAGGAFGNVLRATDISSIFNPGANSVLMGLFSGFLISATLKSAQGSSTVAIITSAAIMAPLLANFGLVSEMNKALMVLSIGAGALTVSHINDSYFWVVSQFSDLSVKEALKSHTVATLLQGLTGLVVVLLLGVLFN